MTILISNDNENLFVNDDHPILKYHFFAELDFSQPIPLSFDILNFIFFGIVNKIDAKEAYGYIEMFSFENDQKKNYYIKLFDLSDDFLLSQLFSYFTFDDLHLL